MQLGILNFNNIQKQSPILNKYHQNPINFKSLESDKFERSGLNQDNDSYSKEKARVGKKVQDKIAQIKCEIQQYKNALEKIIQSKEKMAALYQDERIQEIIVEEYDELYFAKAEYKELKDLIKRLKNCLHSISSAQKQDLEDLTGIIVRLYPEYKAKFEENSPHGDELEKIGAKVLKKLKQEQEKQSKSLDKKENGMIGCIAERISEYDAENKTGLDASEIQDFARLIVTAENESAQSFEQIVDLHYKRKEITRFSAKISLDEGYIQSLNEKFSNYLAMLKEKPYQAPYFEPLTKPEERLRMLANDSDNFVYLDEQQYSEKFIDQFARKGLLNGFYEFERLYDLNDSQNNETLRNLLAYKSPVLAAEIARQYRIPYDSLINLPIKICKFEGSKDMHVACVDISDENTQKTLEEESQKWQRTVPQKSKYCYGEFMRQFSKEIPAAELAAMGYGDVRLLRQMIQDKKIAGKVEKVSTPKGIRYKTTVDLQDPSTPKILEQIRKNTPVASLAQLSKELGITQKRLLECIKEGEVDIIKEYIFLYDSEKKYIDKRNPKNSAFIQKILFENELKNQLKQQELEASELQKAQRRKVNAGLQSLKMSLVWYFCPNTREIASSMVQGDGYLCRLLIKDSNNEELNEKEEAKVNSYRKNMWAKVGTDELKEAYRKANEVFSIYRTQGIDAIEDEQLRNIFKMHESV